MGLTHIISMEYLTHPPLGEERLAPKLKIKNFKNLTLGSRKINGQFYWYAAVCVSRIPINLVLQEVLARHSKNHVLASSCKLDV